MRASRSIPWALSLISVFWATFPDAAAGNTLFGRMSNVFAPGSTTEGTATATSMSSGSTTADGSINDELEELGDAFEENLHLSKILRLMDGDDFGIIQDAWKSKGMEQLFTDPEGLRTMLTAMPMLKAFKGVEEIAAKETLTPADGKVVLENLQKFATLFPEKMAKLSTSESLAQTFKHYAELDDPKLKELMKKSNEGSWKASMGLHKHIIDLEWDNLIDVEKFGGLDGKETSTMKMQRELFQELEPELFKYFMHKDPMVKKYVTNPAAAFEEAKIFARYSPELDVL